MKKSSALGMGLDALFEENDVSSADISARPDLTVRLSDIEPNKNQPRKTFNKESLDELAESIKQHGLLQPILVTEISKGKYRIISGERRWRASRIAGLTKVPVIIKDLSDEDVMEISLVENLQREDLNPIEEAKGYDVLITKFGLTQESVAKKVGKSRPVIANALRILSLPDYVIKMLEEDELNAGQARTLLSVQEKVTEEEFKTFVKNVVEKGLTVRQIEDYAKRLSKAPKVKAKSLASDIYVRAVEEEISSSWGRRVKISGSGKKGKIEIEYYNSEDFENLINILKKQGEN